MSRTKFTLLVFGYIFQPCAIDCEKRRVKNCPMAKSKKNKNKAKLNLTVLDEQREETGTNGLFREAFRV